MITYFQQLVSPQSNGEQEIVLSFKELLSATSRPVLIGFFSDHCTPCKNVLKEVQKVVDKRAEDFQVWVIDVDDYQCLVEECAIIGVPTLLLFNQGAMVWDMPGPVYAQQIDDAIESLLLPR